MESDSIGRVEVGSGRYWGAQSERARRNFRIGWETQPLALIHALGLIKRAAAEENMARGALPRAIGSAIVEAAQEVADGALDAHFPLPVWQTGSGTQTNMNVNEVIANRAIERLGGEMGSKSPVHPNDHVNMSQSSNDTFPTAMHVAALGALVGEVQPALRHLHEALVGRQHAFRGLVKVGRTHTQDATPIGLDQEFSGYAAQVAMAVARIELSLEGLRELAQGGTAVGTGLNAPEGFAEAMAARLSALTGHAFRTAPNKFEALAAHDALVFAHGALNSAAAALFKIANDVRLLGSGPRSGLRELTLPANEPGSSIMPGKVNPTQCEAMTQVCAQIFGNHVTMTFAGSQGQFELNTYGPVMAYNALQSMRLMADAARSFADHCVAGIEARVDTLSANLEQSLMVVTALVPHIGYDRAAAIAQRAHAHGSTIREEATAAGIPPEQLALWLDAEAMTRPGPSDDPMKQ